jgi:hypothetical protein
MSKCVKINKTTLMYMGIHFTDKYSLLHFSSGIICYYWSISLIGWFIIHMLYEIIENQPYIVKIIDTIPIWPGGKKFSDKPINMVGDQFYAVLGWIFTHYYMKFVYGGYV